MENYRQFCFPLPRSKGNYELRKATRMYLPWRLARDWADRLDPQPPQPSDFMFAPPSLRYVTVDLEGSMWGIQTLLRSCELDGPMRNVHQEQLLKPMTSIYKLLIELAKALKAASSALQDADISDKYAYSVFGSSITCISTASESLSNVAMLLHKNSNEIERVSHRGLSSIEQFVDQWENHRLGITCLIISTLLAITGNAININIQMSSSMSIQPRRSLSPKGQAILVATIGIISTSLNFGNVLTKRYRNHKAYDSGNIRNTQLATNSVTEHIFDILDSMANIELYWMKMHDSLGRDKGISRKRVQDSIKSFDDLVTESLTIATKVRSVFPIVKDKSAPLLVHPMTERLQRQAGYPPLRLNW
ncbi:hypothetical protein CPB86DRAFT_878219 [Serendipita vermifera]|nr:hypothetical protein CPB86DRAFT_878219 [Serendipita vermifera]